MTRLLWPMSNKTKSLLNGGLIMGANPDDVVAIQQKESLWPKEIEAIAVKASVESKVERILEMSFDHGAAMLSLLNREAQELKAELELHTIYDAARQTLKKNLHELVLHLEALKFGKGNKLEVFQHKCQEFGL